MLVVRKQSSPFRVILTLSIFCALCSVQIAWPFNGAVSSTSTAPGSQVSLAVSTTDNSQTITITVTNAPTSPSPPSTSPPPTPTSPSPAPNHPPLLAAIGNKSVQVGSTLSFTISATDADGDPLTYSATGLPIGATFDVSARTFTWTPTAAQVGLHNLVFNVSDGRGGTASEAITVTVSSASGSPSPPPASPSPPPNNPPVLAPIGDQTVFATYPLHFTISATDADGDSLSYSATGLPTGATLDATTGTFSWVPPRAHTWAVNYIHPVFTVSDGKGGTASETITVTVTPQNNNPPVLAPIGNKTVQAGANLRFSIGAFDPDADPLTFTAPLLPTGATFTPGNNVIGLDGAAAYFPPATFNWTPTSAEIGSHAATFSVMDSRGGTNSETITISVTPSP